MSKVLLPPTGEILTVCNNLETAIEQFLAAVDNLPEGTFGYWESLDEAYLQIAHTIRHIESITVLARCDLVLLPSAAILVRAIMEIGARAIWLLTPTDPFEREARWLARMRTEIEYHSKNAARLKELGLDAAGELRARDQHQEFYDKVKAVFPSGVKAEVPYLDFASTLIQLNFSSHYLAYSQLSQFVHGTHAGSGLYRRNLGTEKQFGDYVTAQDWALPIRITWFYYFTLCRLFVDRCGGQIDTVFAPSLVRSIEHNLLRIEA